MIASTCPLVTEMHSAGHTDLLSNCVVRWATPEPVYLAARSCGSASDRRRKAVEVRARGRQDPTPGFKDANPSKSGGYGYTYRLWTLLVRDQSSLSFLPATLS